MDLDEGLTPTEALGRIGRRKRLIRGSEKSIEELQDFLTFEISYERKYGDIHTRTVTLGKDGILTLESKRNPSETHIHTHSCEMGCGCCAKISLSRKTALELHEIIRYYYLDGPRPEEEVLEIDEEGDVVKKESLFESDGG